ncbi:MAG: phosphoesterase [Gemmatimonadaceae bacterium]|nr:phosphoesterase [Gemmatimonadaceae bacterium]
MLSRRAFLTSAASAAAGVAGVSGLAAYVRYVEPTWLDITHHVMPIRDLPTALIGTRLAQLSDLHVGPQVDDGYVLDTFARVRALAPEMVAYTGDLTSLHANLAEHADRIYSEMPRGTLGTFASLGNHDYGRQWAEPSAAVRISGVVSSHGATVLRNASTVIEGLHVVGLGDLWAHDFDPSQAFASVPVNAPTIALSHNPDAVDLEGWGAFRGWILAGHTHGGQCKAPFLPPPMLPVKNRRYTSGIFELPNARTMYISRGIGTTLPVRFNVRPEVTIFTLERA